MTETPTTEQLASQIVTEVLATAAPTAPTTPEDEKKAEEIVASMLRLRRRQMPTDLALKYSDKAMLQLRQGMTGNQLAELFDEAIEEGVLECCESRHTYIDRNDE